MARRTYPDEATYARPVTPPRDATATAGTRPAAHAYEAPGTYRAQERTWSSARGGVSLPAILTGVAVALGSMVLLGALVAGIAAAIGLETDLTLGVTEAGWGLGIGFVLAQFLSYFWGGYTAGRMARGAGVWNGLLVPIAAIALVAGVAGIVAAFGAEARFDLPYARSITTDQSVVQFGIGIAIASGIAMFLGGMLGGARGAGWHDRLESRTDETVRVP